MLTENSTVQSISPLALVAGPSWSSFEQFRRGGSNALESIPRHAVGTLQGKTQTFRLIHEDDFQRLLGLATDVHRLQNGLNLVLQATQLVAKHPDQAHIQLLVQSASMIAGSPVLPVRAGHDSFELTPEEEAAQASDDFELGTAEIPRPAF